VEIIESWEFIPPDSVFGADKNLRYNRTIINFEHPPFLGGKIKMNTNLSQRDRQFILALAIGLLVRLLAVPFAMTDHADAVTRIFIAQRWLENPEIITHGVWGPLHTYMLAGMLALWNDPVYAPVVLNSILSAATAIPLYLFVKREWNETSALFTACLYLAYPVAIRYGLMAMTEIPFIFFIALAMWMLSRARDEDADWKPAFMAGIFITLAGALRYESWGLTPFFGLLLWKRWKSMIAFFAAAAIFPLFWLAGNYFATGDAFYSFSWSVAWTTSGTEDETVSLTGYLNRLLFFPRAIVFGLTPLAFLVCALGIFYVIYHRDKKWVWLIPLAALFATFTLNAFTGKLTTQLRYSLALTIYMIPYAAEWFDRQKDAKRRLVHSALVLASMIPLSYLRYAIPWPFDFPHPVPREITMIPRLDESTRQISEYQIRASASQPGGLLLDFYDWGETYYVALMSRKHADNVHVMPSATYRAIDKNEMDTFLGDNPDGVLVLTQAPLHMQLVDTGSGQEIHFNGYDAVLSVEFIGEMEGMQFYRYSLAP
jgi:hypothetical protein